MISQAPTAPSLISKNNATTTGINSKSSGKATNQSPLAVLTAQAGDTSNRPSPFPHSDAGPWSSYLSGLPEPYMTARQHLQEKLTATEEKVMTLCINPGLRIEDIALQMCVSKGTTITHLNRACDKLGVNGRWPGVFRFVACYPEYIGLLLLNIHSAGSDSQRETWGEN